MVYWHRKGWPREEEENGKGWDMKTHSFMLFLYLSQSPHCMTKSLSDCNWSYDFLKQISNMKKVKRTLLLHCFWAATTDKKRVPRKQSCLYVTWCLEIWTLILVHSLVSKHWLSSSGKVNSVISCSALREYLISIVEQHTFLDVNMSSLARGRQAWKLETSFTTNEFVTIYV